jgi:TIR domain
MPEVSLQLFFSYSHKDEALRDELANHLSTLTRQGVISNWHDRKILPGEEWDHQINDNLNTADIILLLVSSDFIGSNYCWEVEVTTAIERHNTGKARVIPVILRKVDWSHTPFAKLQFLPKNAEPVTSWTNRDEAFTNVAQGIRAAAQELKGERQQKLVLARKEAAIAEYRQLVEEFATDGEISFVESEMLKDLQEQLGLTDEEARTMRDKALEPHGKYKENLDKYKQIFTKLVDEQGYALGEKAKADLKKLQQYLKLKDEDVALIDNEAEVQQQQAEKLQQQQQEQAEPKKRRQQKAQKLQRLKEQEEVQRLRLQQGSTPNDLPSDKGVYYTAIVRLLHELLSLYPVLGLFVIAKLRLWWKPKP